MVIENFLVEYRATTSPSYNHSLAPLCFAAVVSVESADFKWSRVTGSSHNQLRIQSAWK